jgi:2-methylcitrate dehydratase PrpD
MTRAVRASVTEQVATWVVGTTADDLPAVAVERVKDRILDSLGVQLGGMTSPTGRVLGDWVAAQAAQPRSTVVGTGLRSTPSLAALVNAAAGNVLEFDDTASFSGHPSNPLTAAALALGEPIGCSGRDLLLAWLVGWEVIAQTSKPCIARHGHTLLSRGWHNEGFQSALGVAALASKLLGLGVDETRMALGNAAAAMGGMLANRGSDTKWFHAGNAAMHGIVAAELAALGFSANRDILDGDDGVVRLLALEHGEPDQVLDGLGSWDMAVGGSWLRLHAACAAAHWGQDALQRIVGRRPLVPDDIASIELAAPPYLLDMLPCHAPMTAMEAKYSAEYALAVIVLDGRAGVAQYTDAMVRRPEAQALLPRVRTEVEDADPRTGVFGSRVTVRLVDGETLTETVTVAHGTVTDPLTEAELTGKFHECAAPLLGEAERAAVLDRCRRLDTLDDVCALTAVLAQPQRRVA